jgi:tetratricopeptide (TPR) repeat protein
VTEAIIRFLRGEDVRATTVVLPPLRFVPIEGYDPKVTHPSASLARLLMATAERSGVDAALAQSRALQRERHLNTETDMNAVAYSMLGRGRFEDAITVFARNVEDYPESGNVYDSLAEAYKIAGDRDRAIELYEKSLEVDPANENAVRMLRELGARAAPPSDGA